MTDFFIDPVWPMIRRKSEARRLRGKVILSLAVTAWAFLGLVAFGAERR